MNSELAGCLVDRIATRLPNRTGTLGSELRRDDIVTSTRSTLINISTTNAAPVLDALLTLLEELPRGNKNFSTHPTHVVLSEVYVIGLAADCCTAHWDAVKKQAGGDSKTARAQGVCPVPPALDSSLVTRFLEILATLLEPVPESFSLPARTILDRAPQEGSGASVPLAAPVEGPFSQPAGPGIDDPREHPAFLESRIKVITEYLTASSWGRALDYFKNVIHSIRSTPAPPHGSNQSSGVFGEEDRPSLRALRLTSFFWVDSQKLGHILQEIGSSFLHFRKPFQVTVATVIPLLVSGWIDRYPQEFVQQHSHHKRPDGGADTLFDMAYTMTDTGRKKGLFFAMQTMLLLLLPSVFEVASNLREAKSNSMSKKISFLDNLRKALRNGNDAAAFCLVSLLRTSRHFHAEDDAAIVSFALDIHDEVRYAVFRRPVSVAGPGAEGHLLEQDLLTAAFVSLAQLNLEGCTDTVSSTYLDSHSPLAFKIAAIQGCGYLACQPDSHQYGKLFSAATPFMFRHIKALPSLASEIKSIGNLDHEEIDEHVRLTCGILEFFDASPDSFLLEDPSSNKTSDTEQNVLEAMLSLVLSTNSTVRTLATGVAGRLFTKQHVVEDLRGRGMLSSYKLRVDFWSRSCRLLIALCDSVMAGGGRAAVRATHEHLAARITLLAALHDLAEMPGDVPELPVTATKLETTFLIALCSPDIETCQLVTYCIGVSMDANAASDATPEAIKVLSPMLRNGVVFSELGSRSFRFTGLVAFQKRFRGLMRKMQFPTFGILAAWEHGFEGWMHLSREVSSSPPQLVQGKTLAEWRNLSGFLASLGGICVANQSFMLEEPSLNSLRWIDRLATENHEEPLLTRYLRLSVQLLGCANVEVREATREVLSSDISPTLYQPLFRVLEAELEVLFTGALAPSDQTFDIEVVFAEQAISLLRALIERLDSPSDLGAASSVHLGSLTLNFAKFMDAFSDTIATLRVKIKVCQLCEVVNKRKEHLNLRDDVRIRNQLLEYIFGWAVQPKSSHKDPGTAISGRHDETYRIQKDLHRACLRSLAELTFRLPLQPGEGQTDVGTNELKSQMFHTYFNRFLSLLNQDSLDSGRSDPAAGGPLRDETGHSTSELAITILSNLLSANIDVGLKHSLNIGYHENIEIRTAFVRVLCNILAQGTEFNNLTDSAVSEKYDELLELLTKDMALVAAMSAVCPSNEVDELAISLLTIFEYRGRSFDLLEVLIKQEIEETENETEILRRTCVATKMLSVYAKWKGQAYLKGTLQKVVERLMLTSKDLGLELDPARVSSPDELKKNALQLQIVAKVFIDDICASSVDIPASFRKVCSIISTAVLPKFQEAKYTAVGAFIFLRFFCPAIVAPEAEGLVDSPPSKELRRGLLLIAKVIQNLANNVLFGAKEPYMYPLNNFLTQNIYRVTTFLREISVAPDDMALSSDLNRYDFGSCVPLHRFLYDHWDHVRQQLVTHERKDFVKSPIQSFKGHSPILEPLRNLVTHLGPPPLAVSWNRPQLAVNSPPSYSRFQDFMLRNAFRSSESFMTARAVYDGGESKDGLSIICIILRHVDTENIDFDTLLFCYFKIASRLWHKPLGLLIDATCYNGQNEPQDELFKKLEMLTPTELKRNLARIYIYNMNSAYRKCFRRLLRVSAKNESSVFHPRNVEYHLIGSLQDLQAHFHLSQLHLPKETISVVTDTRYVFQPITRLSKTKGKIEVIIKVGSQFVQVTTTKRQDVSPGYRLSTTVNDIFRLGEVDEAPTSIQTEDDSAFGLRADNGRIVMYFTSPKKADVLQSIRGAKSKYGKDNRSLKAYERLIRPQDVPGTLLNISFTNLSSPDSTLRLSSYNLLGALCKAFKFSAANKLMCMMDVSVPIHSSNFIIGISQQLARTESQLTCDFLTEFFVGWESLADEQKALSLAYMAPWLPGLRTSMLANEADGEKGKERIAVLFRKLIDVAVSDHFLTFTLEQVVWPAISQDETLLDIFLEELTKAALNFGLTEGSLEALAAIVAGVGTITLRAKVISRLRKALNRSSLRPTRHLPENAVWAEICVLLQFCLSLSFDHGVQSQLYLPEIFHIVTILANTGNGEVRILVHRLLINTIHAACTSFQLDDSKLSKLRANLDVLSEAKHEMFSASSSTFLRDAASISTTQDSGPILAATESLASSLFEICSIAAPSVDICNAWRSRWMSLVASTAFQNNPAVQPRAFAVMGCLAREEVDDDLLYQVLVALRNSVGRLSEENSGDMFIAIVTALSKMMSKLPSASRYGLQLFWLAISLLRLVPPPLFNCAAQFLEAVLMNISAVGGLKGENMANMLMQGRVQLEEAALPLDDAYGIHFGPENFHSAVCACLARGLTDTTTRQAATRVLSTLLDMTSHSDVGSSRAIIDILSSPYTALILARSGSREELKEVFWLAGVNTADTSVLSDTRRAESLDTVDERDILIAVAIELLDFQYLEESLQNRTLRWLAQLIKARPSISTRIFPCLIPILDDVLLHCQNSSTLEAAQMLLWELTSNIPSGQSLKSMATLDDVLEESGLSGLWRSCTVESPQHQDVKCFHLTEKLIEFIII